MRVVVVGCGICGALMALELAKIGHDVVIIEELDRPAAGVTSGAMGWINAVIGSEPEENPDAYSFRQQAFEAHHQLAKDLDGNWPFRQTGALIWERQLEDTHLFFQRHKGAGAAIRLVDAAGLREKLPRLREVPEAAVHLERDGVLDTIEATKVLLKCAEGFGCQSFFNSKGIEILEGSGRVLGVRTPEFTFKADAVVLANGTRMEPLLTPLGVENPVEASPAALVRFVAIAGFSLKEIVGAPGVEVRQLEDGRLQVAEDAEGLDEETIISKARAGLLETFIGLEGRLRVETVRISARPMPRTHSPFDHRVAGFDNLWTFALHPGVILAPLAAQKLAIEIGR